MIRRLLLRWEYGFYAAQAYLASWMGDGIAVANLTSAADEAHRLWCKEKINDC